MDDRSTGARLLGRIAAALRVPTVVPMPGANGAPQMSGVRVEQAAAEIVAILLAIRDPRDRERCLDLAKRVFTEDRDYDAPNPAK